MPKPTSLWLYGQQLAMMQSSIAAAPHDLVAQGGLEGHYHRIAVALAACRQNLSWGDTSTAQANFTQASHQLNCLVEKLSRPGSPKMAKEHLRLASIAQDVADHVLAWPF